METGGLTAKELESLALIAQGHDAKSASRELGVSAHTVYERLRRAREKVGASNSREAARFVFANANNTDENLVVQKLALSDGVTFDAFDAVSGASEVVLTESKLDGKAGYSALSFLHRPGETFPLRAPGERDIGATKIERLRLIGDLSVRLAMVFAAICLAAMIVSTILQRR
jgi:DNA-binding CsgD family transcriptional regulator